jgi:competence protein ComEC
MPRIGWLAIGASAAALAGPVIGAMLGSRAALGLTALGLALLAATVAAIAAVAAAGGLARPSGSAARPAIACRSDRGSRLRMSAAVTIGAAAIAFRVAIGGGAPAAAPPLPGGSGPWTVVVESIGSPSAGQQLATVRLEPGALRIAATLPRYPAIIPGDTVHVEGKIEPLPEDDGGYGTYLRRIGVAATIRARTLDRQSGPGATASRIEILRQASGDALARALPEPEAGLAAGILIGLRDRVDRDLAAAFTTAGVSHVVAISGWNIAIVGAVVAALLRGRLGRRGRSVVTLAAIVAYTIFAGASASVVRAAVMAGVVILARESGRTGAAATALGWAVTLLLLADPRTIGDAGFQLSVLATAGLIAWGTTLTERLRTWRGGRLPGWLAESLGVSLAAEAATLPVVLAAFGRLAILAPAVNLAVVPLVPPAMASGTLALVGGWLTLAGVPPILGTLLGLPGWLVLTILVAVVRFSAALPFASVVLPAPFGPLAGIAVGLVILGIASGRLGRSGLSRLRAAGFGSLGTAWAARYAAFSIRTTNGHGSARARPEAAVPRSGSAIRPRGTPRRPRGTPQPSRLTTPVRLLATVLALSVAAVGIAAANRPDGLVHVTVLDVGQGDAILVEGGRGGRLLVDGGPDPNRLLVTLDARIPPWDRRIDILVLTHPHEDHVAGLAVLMDRYRVGRVFEPGMIGPGPGYRAWRTALDRLGIRPAPLATGDTFGLDQIAFRVLWPDRGSVPLKPADGGTAINNVSIVLLGTVGRQRFLLAADIEEGIDPILLARGLPKVDLLKVAHHGSRTSSTGAFLDAVQPRVAVVSVGAGNPYGHPAPATIARIVDRRVRLFRTDLEGSVEATLDGLGRLEVRPERRQAQAPAAWAPIGEGSAGRAVSTAATGLRDPQRITFSCGVAVSTS